jgi:hypothetical protein
MYFFLSSLTLLPQPPRQCLAPTCHLSTLNYHCIADASSPIHVIGEVSWEPNMFVSNQYFNIVQVILGRIFHYFPAT